MNKAYMIAAILAVAAMAGIAIAKLSPEALTGAASPGGDPADDYGCRTEYEITFAGESVTPVRGLRLELVDVTDAIGPENLHAGVYRLYNQQNQQITSEFLVFPGHVGRGTYNGKSYYVSTLQTAPGFTLNATWAENLFTVCRL